MVFCNTGKEGKNGQSISHNPYFNRWFSAIGFCGSNYFWLELSQSLF